VGAIEKLAAEYGPKLQAADKKMASIFTAEQNKARAEALKAAKEAGKSAEDLRAAVITALKLTPEQEKSQEAAQKEIKDLRVAFDKAVMGLLTEEQQQKVRAAKKGEGAEKPKEKKPVGEKKEKTGEKK
jgi:hypothetical protein